ILGLLNLFSGGALSQFSLFALGIMPYVTASIILPVRSTQTCCARCRRPMLEHPSCSSSARGTSDARPSRWRSRRATHQRRRSSPEDSGSEFVEGRAASSELFCSLLDAPQHLAFHDEGPRLHRQHAQSRSQCGKPEAVATDEAGRAVAFIEQEDPHPVAVLR